MDFYHRLKLQGCSIELVKMAGAAACSQVSAFWGDPNSNTETNKSPVKYGHAN